MASGTIYTNGSLEVTVASGEKIALYSRDACKLYKRVGFPNYPNQWDLVTTTTAGTEYLSDATTAETVFKVEAGAAECYYETGAAPSIFEPLANQSMSAAAATITGLAAAQGGSVTIKGGTSSTAGNAGGAAALLGGQAGETGVGGAATVTGAAGGATSGNGGAATVTGGAGTNGNATGGAASLIGGAGQGTGAGGGVVITGGASGAGATGNGGDVTITGGAASSTNGDGGSVVIRPTVGSGSGIAGQVLLGRSTGTAAWGFGCVRSTVSNAGTVSDAQHRGMVLYQDASGGNVTMTTRTGTQLAAAFPDMAVGDALPQYMCSNHGSNTSTISGGTDVTLVGSGAVTQTGGSFLLIKTAATTFDLVRVG